MQLFFEYRRDITQIEKTVEQIKKSHQATITQALWVYEVSIMEMQLQGIRHLPDVNYVCVRKDSNIIMESGSKTADRHFLLYEFPLSHTLRNKQIRIGTLTVKISLSAVYQRLWDRVMIILLTQALKTFFVSIFIFFLFYQIIGRHLASMAVYARSVRLQNPGPPLVLKRKRKRHTDELGLVESALNSMRQSLITEMENVRISQDALRKSEERFKSLVSNIPGIVYRRRPVPIWETDYISDSVRDISGYPAADFLTGDFGFEKLVHPEDLAALTEKIRAHTARGDAFEMEYRIRHKDGRIRFVMEKGRAVCDERHQPLWLDGVILDISDRVETEQRLREKDLLLHSIIENTGDAVFLKDTEGRYVIANTATLRAVGRPESQVIGRTDFELFPQKSAEVLSKADKKIMASGESMITEEKLETSYGETYWQANKSPLTDDRGNLIGILGISRNVTELKQVQAQNEELEKKLMQAQKLQSIGTLAGGIAHDFNNLLFPIIGMAELLLDDLPRDSQEYRNTQEILSAGLRGRDIVKQILAFSRESENIRIPVSVQRILTEALHLARATIPADIEIEQRISHDCGLILADPTQIHQVVMNLITNAFHAVESAGGKIRIRLREVAPEAEGLISPAHDGKPYLLLSVSDTGHGIAPDVMNRIFEPYFTTKEQGKGTGLGLSLVYGIIQKHKGEIKVHSEPGKGTTVTVYLPQTDREDCIKTDENVNERRRGNEHILLLDDEDSVAMLEKQILEKFGYRVSCCTDSPEALEMCRNNPGMFDLLITDMTMPKMSGVQLSEQLLSLRPDMPIILCTGFSDKIDRKTAASLGIKAFLMKPVSVDELAETVRKVLDEAKGNRQET